MFKYEYKSDQNHVLPADNHLRGDWAEDTTKTPFYSRTITQPKIIQPEKSIKGHNSDKNQ